MKKHFFYFVLVLCAAAFSFTGGNIYAQGVGIDVSSPNTKLDVNGDFALRVGSLTLGNGTNHNIAVGSKSFIRISGPTNNFTITGISGGVDGKMIIIYNSTGHQMSITHQGTGSSASNRIICSNGANVNILPYGTATLIYSAIDSRWVLVSLHKQ